MNKFLTLILIIVLGSNLWAQSPQKFSYQAVIRGSNNELIVNKSVGVKISLLQGSSDKGEVVYSETHNLTTNSNGLISLAIGDGKKTEGNFITIDWSKGPYFVKVDTDPNGGTSYSLTTTSQLMSVPYALFAANTSAGAKGETGSQGLYVPDIG